MTRASLIACTAGVVATFFAAAPAALAAPDDVYMRVVDVGAGLCVVAVAPGGHTMVFDAGRGSSVCLSAVKELVPGRKIDLLVLSHSDIDHVGSVVKIVDYADVATIIHPGDTRGPALDPIRTAIDEEGADVWNLQSRMPTLGQSFAVGAATATFVAGWPNGDATIDRGDGTTDPSLDDAGRNNALSIVIRFEYRGHAVLLTGDTVGRQVSSNDSLCQYSERIMERRAATIPLKSDVLIGQHHGGDNATSNCFIKAVMHRLPSGKPDPKRPLRVVFSAGSMYRHPRQSVADRLVANGVLPADMFRTDRGDHEEGTGREREWVLGTYLGCPPEESGDDDVEVILPGARNRPVNVRYRSAWEGC